MRDGALDPPTHDDIRCIYYRYICVYIIGIHGVYIIGIYGVYIIGIHGVYIIGIYVYIL